MLSNTRQRYPVISDKSPYKSGSHVIGDQTSSESSGIHTETLQLIYQLFHAKEKMMSYSDQMELPREVEPMQVDEDEGPGGAEPMQVERLEEADWLPSHWSTMSSGAPTLAVSLSEHSEEYKSVLSYFRDSFRHHGLTVRRVVRVQNVFLWRHFALKREEMQHEQGRHDVNERRLFHGTRTCNVDGICRKGFQCSLARRAMYGVGSYFASTSFYSHMYSPDTEPRQDFPTTIQQAVSPSTASSSPACAQGLRYMFVARVLVGRSVRGNSSYRRPPALLLGDPNAGTFDSCVDSDYDPSIFVVFDTNQAYPEYLLEYTCTCPCT